MWSLKDIASEMAQRKISFHARKDWRKIKLWGLFSWGDVSAYLVGNPGNLRTFKKGYLKTDMRKEHGIIWVTPTKEFWCKYIKPEIEKLVREGVGKDVVI